MAKANETVEVAAQLAPPGVVVRVWDLPTRLFHWLLVLSVVGSFTTGYLGGNAMAWHLRFGYVSFTLLVFRLLWGFCGGHWSRFRSFAYAPAASSALPAGAEPPRRAPSRRPQSARRGLGVRAARRARRAGRDRPLRRRRDRDHGPLNRFVTANVASLLTHWHKDFGQRIIMVLVLLHVGAILFYLLRLRRNLVGPMLSGDKVLEPGVPPAVDSARSRLLALALVAGAAAGVAWLVTLGG